MSERWARAILTTYRWVGAAAYPAIGGYVAWRASKGKEERSRRRERYGKAPDGVTDMYDLIYDGHTLITRYDKGLADVWTVMSTINNYMAEGVPASTIVERVEPLINAEIEKAFTK